MAAAHVAEMRSSTIDYRTSIYRDAVAIIETEYASELRVEDIARRVASSRRQVQRSFAEIGHTTVSQHLSDVRMRHAAALLAGTPISVRDIALRVGYRQPAHFAKVFRMHHGEAPSAFR